VSCSVTLWCLTVDLNLGLSHQSHVSYPYSFANVLLLAPARSKILDIDVVTCSVLSLMSSLVLYCLWIESLFQLNVTDGLFGLERVFSGLKLMFIQYIKLFYFNGEFLFFKKDPFKFKDNNVAYEG